MSEVSRKRTSGFWRSLSAFLRDFLRYAGRGVGAVAALVTGAALVESLGVVSLVPILGLVVDGQAAGGGVRRVAQGFFDAAQAETPFQRLALLLALFGVLVLLRAILTTWRDVRLAALQIGFLESLRGDIAERLAGARWDHLVRLRHARVTHLISGDVQRVSTGANFLVQGVVAGVMLAAQCVLVLVLQPALGAFALALLVVMGLAVAPMVRRSQQLGQYMSRANLSLLDETSQFLGGLKLAVSQNMQAGFTASFRETLGRLRQQQIDNIRQRSLGRVALNLVSAAVGAAIVLIGFGVLHTPAPLLIALLLVITRMAGPVGQIQQGLQQVAAALPAYELVSQLRDELGAAQVSAADTAGTSFPAGDVVFDRVSFRHPVEGQDEGGRGVEWLSLTVGAGEFLGVGGPSGAGKTTFADLLVGLYPPQSGRIVVGDQALEGAALAAWRAGLAYVSQDPFLFHDTVRANLVWARPGCREDELWDALALAGADDLVRRMDRGLDTVVGERGALVSGGERQRMALARAVLRRPRLLVLDEATNALDIASERTVLERLLALQPTPAIVLIAHRPESLALCHRVMRLEGGRVADETQPSVLAAAS